MKATTALESRKASMLKLVRSIIRLRYSIMADEEIRRMLPEMERRIDLALQSGQPLELDAATIIAEVEDYEANPSAS